MHSPIEKSDNPINMDDCYRHIEQEIFKLQPESYHEENPIWPGYVGLEIEMLPIRKSDLSKPQLVPLTGENPLHPMIEKIAAENKWENVFDEGHLLLVHADEGDNLSFEPGGQLEFSSRPYECLSDAIERTVKVQDILDKRLGDFGVEIVQCGINPWYDADGVGLQMQKKRYLAMNEYFARIGSFGKQMMRTTCTFQVNLDFGPDEKSMHDRFLAASLMAPFVNAAFSYSAFVGGTPATVHGARGRTWLNIDPSRTGVPDLKDLINSRTKKACVDYYAKFAFNAHVIFDQNYKVPNKKITFLDWIQNGIEGKKPTFENFKTHLTLLFPEVRARGFLELRSVDNQSRVWQFVPALFYTGILYDHKSLESALDVLLPFANQIDGLLKKAVFGLQDPEIKKTAQKLFELASDGFSRVPPCYRENCEVQNLQKFYETFVARGRTPADDLLDFYKRDSANDQTLELALKTIRKTENFWRERL